MHCPTFYQSSHLVFTHVNSAYIVYSDPNSTTNLSSDHRPASILSSDSDPPYRSSSDPNPARFLSSDPNPATVLNSDPHFLTVAHILSIHYNSCHNYVEICATVFSSVISEEHSILLPLMGVFIQFSNRPSDSPVCRIRSTLWHHRLISSRFFLVVAIPCITTFLHAILTLTVRVPLIISSY